MSHSPTRRTRLLALAVSLTFHTLPYAQTAAEHTGDGHGQASHQHANQQTHELERNRGQRWNTDAPLREGMERIRTAVDEAMRHTKASGALDAAKAEKLTGAVDESIQFIVTHCRLEPQADANLHILIGRLAESAAAIKADPDSEQGLSTMRSALDQYPRYFNHPGW